MVNFKKVLGLVAPALAFAGIALGQTPVQCSVVSPGAPYIRAEGTTELLPPITVLCPPSTGVNPLPPTLNAQVFITPVTGLTSKVLPTGTALPGGGTTVAGQTEIVASPTTTTGPAVGGTVSANAVSFTGITSGPSSTTANWTPFVVSNIRIDASKIPVASGIPNAVDVSVFITSGNAVIAVVPATPIAYVVPGLATTTIKGAGAIPVCSGAANTPFTLNVSDFFPGAFKTAGPPSQFSEASTVAIGTANAVNSGTRLKMVFSNVPSGTTLYMPTSVVAGNGSIINMTSSETGAFSQVAASTTTGAPAGTAALTITGGGGQAVYEVFLANSTTIDTYAIPVYVVAASNGVPPTSTPMGVAVSFAPIGSTNIPNFVIGSSTTVLNGDSFAACATNLLFSYLTNQQGYDTGLAISNTSTDPFGKNGAAPQTGNCTLNFYGAGAPTPVTTPMVPSGTVFTQILSSIAPGFQGYMIAQCNFLFGHGFAFITNGLGASGGVSDGYLASVIPDANLSPRKANPASQAGAGSGESLGH